MQNFFAYKHVSLCTYTEQGVMSGHISACVCDQISVCILSVVNHCQSLPATCSQDLYVAQDASWISSDALKVMACMCSLH